METFVQDVRFALRGLRRAPGFAAAAILTLALGMGATTAIFSVIRSVLMAPLPYAEPERRVMIWSRWKDFDKTWVADGEVDDYRRLCPSLESVAAWSIDVAVTAVGQLSGRPSGARTRAASSDWKPGIQAEDFGADRIDQSHRLPGRAYDERHAASGREESSTRRWRRRG